MQETGKITIGEKSYKVFLDEIYSSAPTEEINIPLPEEIKPLPIPNNNAISILKEEIKGNERKFVISANGVKGIQYNIENDNISTFYGACFVPAHAVWVHNLIFNDGSKIKIELNGPTGVFKIGDVSKPDEVVIQPVTVIESTVVPTTTQRNEFGKIGQVYQSKKRGKLILPSHNNSGGGQIFKVSKDGVEIHSYDRHSGWKPESAYWGNHGKESQFAIDNGKLDFYFRNTHDKPVIVGFTTGNQYSFYEILGELEKTNYFKELEAGQECSFSLDFNNDTQFESIERNWDNSQNTFKLTCPFYENGTITTDRILEENGTNGFTIDENKTSVHKFYKQSNPSVNTTIRFVTKSIYEEPTFEVLEINGLFINPSFTMLSCYSVTQGKVFCNDSNGYVWSKHYKTF